MATTEQAPARPEASDALLGSAPPSEAGPLESGSRPIAMPASMPLSPFRQILRFSRGRCPSSSARRELGETFALRVSGAMSRSSSRPPGPREVALHRAAELVPSMTAESPLRPIVGESVLTANGARTCASASCCCRPSTARRSRATPRRSSAMIERELDGWRDGGHFALTKRMQAVTLDVIMAGIFGVEGEPEQGTTERRLRDVTRRLLAFSEQPAFALLELREHGRTEAVGLLKRMLDSRPPLLPDHQRAPLRAGGRARPRRPLAAALDDRRGGRAR